MTSKFDPNNAQNAIEVFLLFSLFLLKLTDRSHVPQIEKQWVLVRLNWLNNPDNPPKVRSQGRRARTGNLSSECPHVGPPLMLSALKTYWNLLEKVPPRALKLSKYESEQPPGFLPP